MAKFYYKEESKKNWFVEKTDMATNEDLTLGAILRIADATEKMAANYVRMENDLKYLGNRNRENLATIDRLNRSNAALRGHIKRLKNKSS